MNNNTTTATNKRNPVPYASSTNISDMAVDGSSDERLIVEQLRWQQLTATAVPATTPTRIMTHLEGVGGVSTAAPRLLLLLVLLPSAPPSGSSTAP